jgi:hypothetical protein
VKRFSLRKSNTFSADGVMPKGGDSPSRGISAITIYVPVDKHSAALIHR